MGQDSAHMPDPAVKNLPLLFSQQPVFLGQISFSLIDPISELLYPPIEIENPLVAVQMFLLLLCQLNLQRGH